MSIPIAPKTHPQNFAPVADISLYQDRPETTADDIDASAFAAAGFACAIIKVTEGASIKDPSFRSSLRKMVAAKVPCGVYTFNRPRDVEGDAEREADYAVDAVGDDIGDVRFFVLDIEEDPPKLSPVELAWWLVRAGRRIRSKTGRVVGLYTSPSYAARYIAPIEELKEFFLWVAHWGVRSPAQIKPWPADGWRFWQDGLAKAGAGIQYDFDHNWFHGTREEFAAWLEAIDPQDPCDHRNYRASWAARLLCDLPYPPEEDPEPKA